ncbi:8682_t:CDS:10 [Ambispora leptoticha]|uniref:xanthine dehydrogenase n=1 Tax=Ambispora leptoticha TaxID=144679 RepID=A0A9N8VIS7_9GLOM|nr:8682_t:CDS:10 [Ambispora leptoticha]
MSERDNLAETAGTAGNKQARKKRNLKKRQKTLIPTELTTLILSRKRSMCNVLEFGEHKVIYKRYASLYFAAGIDWDENELYVLEVIHRYVQVLDEYFGNVCELDIIYNFDKAYQVLDELIMGGEMQEPNRKAIVRHISGFEKFCELDVITTNIKNTVMLSLAPLTPDSQKHPCINSANTFDDNTMVSNIIEEGEVTLGACTVLVSHYDPTTRKIINSSVNACLAPLCSIDGKHVITIEGVGSSHKPHPVQERIALMHGSQCGYCTPGIVMSLYALLRNNPEPSEIEIEDCLDGNLCRCTGYRPILDAAKTFASDSPFTIRQSGIGDEKCDDLDGSRVDDNSCLEKSQKKGCGREKCCQLNEKPEDFIILDKFPQYKLKRYDPSQELIFPPSLMNRVLTPLSFTGRKTKWFRPTNLNQLLDLKRLYPSAKLVSGNTRVGIETKFEKLEYPIQIYVGDVEELQGWEFGEHGLTIGANINFSKLIKVLQDACGHYKPYQTQIFQAILNSLRRFGGTQIRNIATPAGNIITGSPTSDLNPILLATNTLFTLASLINDSDQTKIQRVVSSASFWTGYKKSILAEIEILESIFIPCSVENEFVRTYKQAKRRDGDIAIVNAALRVSLNNEFLVRDASFSFGGMGDVTLRAQQSETFVKGQKWGDDKVLQGLLDTLLQELQLNFSAPRGMASYRRSLAAGFLYKFWHDVGTKLGLFTINKSSDKMIIADEFTELIERKVSRGVQSVGKPEDGKIHVGKSIPHASAFSQVAGEAVYVDDIPKIHGELYGALLLSKEPHAKILSIDANEALTQPGVRGFFSAKDVPGKNSWGFIFKDEEIFASSEVHCVGQIIGLIVADSQTLAQEAVRLVKVEYDRLPYILTIEEAIKYHSFFPVAPEFSRGDIDNAFNEADYTFEGSCRIGGQEHFYMETQVSLVIPKPENHEFEIHAATQAPTEIQEVLASALGISSNKIVCRVKRLGGAFGGKETRSIQLAAPLAIGAWHTKKPVRCMLNRDEDMIITGQRHPALAHWRIGINKDGRIKGLDLFVYLNAGWTSDLSPAILGWAMVHSDNCYYIPNMRVRGKICKTNIHSNTAFRGFGAPQGMLIMENIINEVADSMGISVDSLREINFYKEGQKTHYDQLLTDWHLPQLYQHLKTTSEFEKRRREVDLYNANHKWRKRGLAFTPSKFGLGFPYLFMNQAGALIHIYIDGSVLVSHGGVEMGQGLHTKMLQIAAEALSIPLDQVHLMETSTNSVANATTTGGSLSSDLNGYAVANGCEKLAERLRPYREKMPNASFKEIVQAAYFDRVNLSANGFYKTPDLGYSMERNKGQMVSYFTMGAAVSEVEIDTLTGDHTILRTDLCMDIGKSLNYAIDIGQIEGGFVQGVGWCTIEESLFLQSGHLYTRGPGNYKIPGFRNIPQDFRVSIFQGAQYPHLKTIHSSKGIGEPPFFLGSSVFFAIRDAIKAARKANSVNKIVNLCSPATPERIRMACIDPISIAASVSKKDDEESWIVMA